MIKFDYELKKLKMILLQDNQLLLMNIHPKKVIDPDDQDAINFTHLERLFNKNELNLLLYSRQVAEDFIEPEFEEILGAYQSCLAESDKPDEF